MPSEGRMLQVDISSLSDISCISGPDCTADLERVGRACQQADNTAAQQLSTVLRMQQLAAMLQQLGGVLHSQQQQQPSCSPLQQLNDFSTAQAPKQPSTAWPQDAFESETAVTTDNTAAPVQRTLSNTTAGAVLRTLSTSNPRVLALAAAAARAPAGSTLKSAALAALKNEIVQFAQDADADAVPSSSHQATTPPAAAAEDSSLNTAVTHAAASAEQQPAISGSLEQQAQPLTQDALWAALVAKARGAATACSQLSTSPQQQLEQQLRQHSLSRLSCRPSPDSCQADGDGTSCVLPSALLQAVQQAHQQEEEKEASATAAGAAAAAAATDATTSMDEDAIEGGGTGSPSHDRGAGSSLRITNQIVFKRRSTANSNALQRHFNAKLAAGHVQQQQQRAKAAQNDGSAAATAKPHHLFKKQQRRRPLMMHSSSSGNLVGLHQASKAKLQQQLSAAASPRQPRGAASAAAAAAEPECSNTTGGSGGNGSLLSNGWADGLRALMPTGSRPATSAATAPAALGLEGDSVSTFLHTLAFREQQLLLLQQQLREQRQQMLAKQQQQRQQQTQRSAAVALGNLMSSSMHAPVGTMADQGGVEVDPSAVADLQRLLGLAVAAAGPPAAPVSAVRSGLMAAAAAMTHDDAVMTDAPGSLPPMDPAMRAAVPVAHLPVQRDQKQQQQQPVGPPAEGRSLEALVSIASALLAQQQEPEPEPMPAVPEVAAANVDPAGSALAPGADILRRLAAALQPLV